jgi:predicted transport protein
MPLYQLQSGKVSQIKQVPFPKERELQRLFQDNLSALLGVRFVASEFSTGDRQRGRIDTLGLDQDNAPTIVEYKKVSKDNVINQGLFYLDWLVDHKGDFTLAVQQTLGNDVQINWSNPRLILVAESFSDYDKYAVNRIGANIELWVYRLYDKKFVYLEPIFVATGTKQKKKVEASEKTEDILAEEPIYTIEGHLLGKPEALVDLFEQMRERIFMLGDEDAITEKANKLYIGYKHGKNFCEVKIQNQGLKLWLDIPYEELNDPKKLGKDVTGIGHHGTGSVAVRLIEPKDLDDVMALIQQSYQQTV